MALGFPNYDDVGGVFTITDAPHRPATNAFQDHVREPRLVQDILLLYVSNLTFVREAESLPALFIQTELRKQQ